MPNRGKMLILGLLMMTGTLMVYIYHEFLETDCRYDLRRTRQNSTCSFYHSMSKNMENGRRGQSSLSESKKSTKMENRSLSSKIEHNPSKKPDKTKQRSTNLQKLSLNRTLVARKHYFQIGQEALKLEVPKKQEAMQFKRVVKNKRGNVYKFNKKRNNNFAMEKNRKYFYNTSYKTTALSIIKAVKDKVLKTFTIKNKVTFHRRKVSLESKKEEAIQNNALKASSCPTWKVDEQDWTLLYRDEISEIPKHCSKPVIDSKIKRIIYKNGTIVYTGCTNKTSECNEKAHYDFKLGQRINTPPCCRFHVLKMFQQLTDELKRKNISHGMISGGVIGWVRNKKMVPYDRDLDLVIDKNFWNTTGFWDMMSELNRKYGYEYKLVEDLKLKLYLSKENRNEVDVWAYWIHNATFDIEYFASKKQPADTMVPFREVQFEWFRTFVPNRPKEYLNRQYGKERWPIEKQCMVRDAEDNCW